MGSELPGYVVYVAGMFRMQLAALRTARIRFRASSPVKCWPSEVVRGTCREAPKAFLDEGQPAIARGVLGQVAGDERPEGAHPEERHQPSGRSMWCSSRPGRAKPPAPSAIRISALSRASLYVEDLRSLNTTCRSRGRAPAPSSGSRSQMTSHRIPIRPAASARVSLHRLQAVPAPRPRPQSDAPPVAVPGGDSPSCCRRDSSPRPASGRPGRACSAERASTPRSARPGRR